MGWPRKSRIFGPFGYAQGKRDDTAGAERTHPLHTAQRVGHPKWPCRTKAALATSPGEEVQFVGAQSAVKAAASRRTPNLVRIRETSDVAESNCAEERRELIGGRLRTFCRDAEDRLAGVRGGCVEVIPLMLPPTSQRSSGVKTPESPGFSARLPFAALRVKSRALPGTIREMVFICTVKRRRRGKNGVTKVGKISFRRRSPNGKSARSACHRFKKRSPSPSKQPGKLAWKSFLRASKAICAVRRAANLAGKPCGNG